MSEQPLSGRKVLVVDDDPDILTAISAAMEDAGATVETARDGNAAVELALKGRPDVIVLDAMLPKRSGFLVMEKIKSVRKPGGPPYVIMITGNTGRRHQEWAASLGVDEYMTKPFRMDRLLDSAAKLVASQEGN